MWCLLLLAFFSACTPVFPIEDPFPERSTDPASVSSDRPLLTILALDVGQGDATLIIGPDGTTLLIDGGPPETGAPPILEALQEREIKRLDWVVVSHYDIDHIGGLPAVLAAVPAEQVLDRGDATDQDHPLFLDYLDQAEPIRQQAEPGRTIPLGTDAAATVIVVNGRYSDGTSIHLNPEEENESSVGLLIRYGEFEYFTAGDLTGGGTTGGKETKDLESRAGEIIGDIDVLHTGHHGSATSTNEKFLQLTRPETAIISVGNDNDYGHPTQTVLDRLEAAGAAVYRTDRSGSLEIITDGSRFEIAPVNEAE